MDDKELMHYGVLGMKWGVRKAQYQSNRLQRRVDKLKAKKKEQDKLLRAKNKVAKLKNQKIELENAVKGRTNKLDELKGDKSKTENRAKRSKHVKLKNMTDEELRARINRLQMEKQYNDLIGNNQQKIRKGEGQVNKWAKETAKTILVDTSVDVGKQAVKYWLTKAANEKIGEDVIFTNNKKKS